MQEWFVLEELSHYDATVNPYFSDSEGKARSSAQFQSEGDQSWSLLFLIIQKIVANFI